VFLATMGPPADAQTPRAERPVLAVGQTWVRDDGRFELVRFDGARYVFQAPDTEIHLSRDLAVAKVLRYGLIATEFDPPPEIRWPLEVGARWSSTGAFRPPGAQRVQAEFDWTVDGYESVAVPAGRFDAYRLTLAIRELMSGGSGFGSRSRSRSGWTIRTWYAPAVGQLVRAEGIPFANLAFQVVAVERPGPIAVTSSPGSIPVPVAPAASPPAAVTARAGEGPTTAPVPPASPAPPAAPAMPAGIQVVLAAPRDQERVAAETITLAGVATAASGVARVVVALNGIEVARLAEPTPQRALALNAPLSLREGANTLVVTATAVDGTIRQEVRTVVRDGAPPATSFARAPARQTWAVVVGIGRYESPDIPTLRYAVADAEALYRTLTGPMGFRKDHVILLTDRTERKPTLRNIRWALGTFLARSAQKDDTVIVFFAGHGAPEIDLRGVERDGLSKYLISADADPDDLYSTALPMDEIQTIFGRIEAERVVVFLDACYSGAAGGRTFASKRVRNVNVDDLFLERLTRAKGRVIITASRSSEVSLEMADLGHGLFTYHLLQGLQGAGDTNRDGIVSLQELYEYVEQAVARQSRAVGGNQHPVLKGELEGTFPLAKTPLR
jgi:hypothetical protein